MSLATSFERWFGAPSEIQVAAPGRVNLMGEHTDYNGGWVLPLALPLYAHVHLAPRPDAQVRVCSVQAPGPSPRAFSLNAMSRQGDWLDYIRGALGVLRDAGATVGGVDIGIDSQVPLGAGLSSSAALCVALLRGLSRLWGHPLEDTRIAQLAQQVENHWVGAHVGIMDPMAASLGRPHAALYLNTATLQASLCPIPPTLEFLVIDSGERHSHATGDYNTRRRESEAAARALGVPYLSQLDVEKDRGRCERLPTPLGRRARHVMEENARVHSTADALRRGDAAAVAEAFAASHASQRDLYDLSVPAIETLVEALSSQPAILGTRLTGGGFGGSVVSVAQRGAGAAAAERAIATAAALGVRARLLNIT